MAASHTNISLAPTYLPKNPNGAVMHKAVTWAVSLPSALMRFSEAFLRALPRNYNEICRGWVQPGWIDYY